MVEAPAHTPGPGRRPKLKSRRATTVRVAVYTLSAVLSVWLVASVVVALAHGLASESVYDPFTEERVPATEQGEP